MTAGAVLLVVLIGVLLGVNVGLSGGTGKPSATPPTRPSTSSTAPPPAPLRVSAERQVTFVDNCTTCTTENYLTGTTSAGRSLVTDVWYPTRDGTTPATTNASAPLVLLASGFNLDPTDYLPLVDAWVLAGYVVAAPNFPATDAAAAAPVLRTFPTYPHGDPESDTVHEPSDMAFVLQQLVADDTAGASGGAQSGSGFLAGLFDSSEIAVAGQSDGGDVVAALGYNSCCNAGPAATHIQAVAVLSGAENSGLFTGSWFATPGPPLLVAQGTNDACNQPPASTTLYDAAPATGAKYFLTLLGADHLAGYATAGPSSSAVAATTTAFFDLYLHHGKATTASVLAAGTTSVSQMTDAAIAPTLKSVATWTYNPGTSLDPCSLSFAGPPASTSTTAAG